MQLAPFRPGARRARIRKRQAVISSMEPAPVLRSLRTSNATVCDKRLLLRGCSTAAIPVRISSADSKAPDRLISQADRDGGDQPQNLEGNVPTHDSPAEI
jgi:hypothetical protein